MKLISLVQTFIVSLNTTAGGTSNHKLPPCVRKQEKQTKLCWHANCVPFFIQDELLDLQIMLSWRSSSFK